MAIIKLYVWLLVSDTVALNSGQCGSELSEYSLPLGIQNFIATGSWVNSAFEYFLVIVQIGIWYPFFKTYEKTLVAREQEAQNEEIETLETAKAI